MSTVDNFSLSDSNDFRRYRKSNVFKKGLAVGIDRGDGEVMDAMVSLSDDKHVHDNTKFVKVFAEGASVIGSLNGFGAKLLGYIFNELRGCNGGLIDMPVGSVLLHCGYSGSSRSVYYTNVKKLVVLGVIKAVGSKWQVNPNMFYYGDRCKDMPDVVKEYMNKKYSNVNKSI